MRKTISRVGLFPVKIGSEILGSVKQCVSVKGVKSEKLTVKVQKKPSN